jgi:UDP-N-acetylmuramate-alanine ligase
MIEQEMHKLGYTNAYFIADRNLLLAGVLSAVRDGDMVVVMGAGDITRFADKLAEELRKPN